MDHSNHGRKDGGFFASRTNIVLIGFLAIGGFYLVAEHRAHLIPYLGYLPFLLILACPLMHGFMHSRHEGHGGGGDADAKSPDDRENTPSHRH